MSKGKIIFYICFALSVALNVGLVCTAVFYRGQASNAVVLADQLSDKLTALQTGIGEAKQTDRELGERIDSSIGTGSQLGKKLEDSQGLVNDLARREAEAHRVIDEGIGRSQEDTGAIARSVDRAKKLLDEIREANRRASSYCQ